jgi:glycosyltransferase involved in cell wall biosynthesis
MVTNMYPTDENPGFGAFVKSQIDSIAAEGHDVEVFKIEGRGSAWNYVSAVGRLHALLARRRFDIIHAHYGLSGVVASAQHRCPFVISYCGDDLLGTSDGMGGITRMSRFVIRLSQYVARRAAGIIVKSKEMVGRIDSAEARGKAVVIPNGVDFDLFRPADGGEARKKLGFAPDKGYVMFAGEPGVRIKRFDLAQASIGLLKEDYPEVELVAVHHQPQETVVDYMNACDAMLLTSDSEGSPNVVKEAMACNMPIVAVDAGDAWEVIEGVEQCRRAERNPVDIAEQLDAVIKAGGRSNGRERIGHLELSEVAKRVVAVYENVLSGN